MGLRVRGRAVLFLGRQAHCRDHCRLNEMQGLTMPVEALAEHKEDLYFSLLPQLKAIPEVIEIIEAQHGQIPFGVVSGGRRSSVMARSPLSD